MISNKLKTIFGLSVPLFIAHGLEEYFTGFYDIDSHFLYVFRPILYMPMNQGVFLTFQIMIWLLFIFSFLLVSGIKWQLRLMLLLGFGYFYEMHHIYKAIAVGGYYPGVITALGFPFFTYFFWKEFWKISRQV